ncbi:NmrA family NAD(P)-binding protein [Streptomyces sp. NPDC057654]|uniref:NmrA family NAD(P)-binding protein n=1 Tax=Streptomyces sp. NPDC057654 TaxID=3346196 RepID=UPI00369EE56A
MQTTDDTFLVTGGTGNTGRRVAARLAGLGHRARAGSRRPPAGQAAPGVEHARFDWDDASTHAPALAGVRGLYLVPPVAASDPAAPMLPFLRTARSLGVRRVVLLSSSAIPEGDEGGANGDSRLGLGAVHRAVREEFPEWAVLQPSWFMQNFTGDHIHAHSIRADDEIVTATGDGRVGFVDVEDIAEVGVRALTDARPHNTAHLITGPEALSYADVAATVSGLAGRSVRHRAIGYEAMRERLTASGIPERFADLLAGMDRAISEGAEDRTSPTVERVTGRPPRTFAAHAAANTAAWKRN